MRGQHHINLQAIVQTGLKHHVVDTTNTKILCLQYGGSFLSLRFQNMM